jgi:putative Mg2+ transporter-C (MgtC) family protein
VAGAAALFVGLGDVLIEHFSETLQTASISSDPIRVMQAVLTGVSFLGAGTILRRTDESKVEGLTTAASILFAAAVGSTVALEQFIVAVGSTLLVLVTLRGLGILEHRLWHDGEYHE